MRKALILCLGIVTALALMSGSASAKGLQVGGGVEYGKMVFVNETDDMMNMAPLLVFDVWGSYGVTDKLKLAVEYAYGRANPEEEVDFGWFYAKAYGYSNLKLSATYQLTNHLALLAGWTRFSSDYTTREYWDDYPYVDTVVSSSGGGIKVGFAGEVPVTKSLSAYVRYAYLPFMNAKTYIDEGVYPENGSSPYLYDTYKGTGDEFEAKLNLAIIAGLSASLGVRRDSYWGKSESDAQYYLPASYKSIFCGISYKF